MGLNEQHLTPYVATRWLSLENSLSRLLDVWEPLKSYFELLKKGDNDDEIEDEESENEEDTDERENFAVASKNRWPDLLNDPIFKFKLSLLLTIIEKVNVTNRIFQSQSMQIQNLKLQMISLYNKIAKLAITSDKTTEKIETLIQVQWSNKKTRDKWFMSDDDFLAYITTKGDSKRLGELMNSLTTDEKKKDFVKIF